jgi:outer membrane biosynthesis protein TonB
MFHPLTGTEIMLNKSPILSYPNKNLFNALLRCWIGDVPPSRLFRSDILGAESIVTSNSESHLTRFNTLEIKKERVNLVASWREDEEKAKRALDLAAAEIERSKKAEVEALALLEANSKQESKAQANSEKKNEKINKTPVEKNTQSSAINQENTRQVLQDKELAKLKAKQTIRAYYSKVYEWEIAAQIHERVAYPEWGRQFELGGNVTLSFIVNKQGELIGVTDIQPQNSGLLGDALKEALLKASPFKTFPEVLENDQLVLSVSYHFDPSIDKSAEILAPRPIKPSNFESLLRLASL